ncbi:MAG: lamin tail domain-containing protein [Gammaproteobacteria bacterium]|nr:lamin tail domain-containing protein [Gammaproteobacteria bacterium]MDH5593226.1 lamin tail domain-containing protein [Gammaproteobacteria bacterium]
MNRKRIFSSVLFFGLFSNLPQAHAGLILSEVMYDPVSADDSYEWVELFNNSASTIDLSNYSLGWGGSDYTYGTMQLSGSITSGSYFVVGGPLSGVTNGSPLFDLALDFNPGLQNGGTQSDGVALFDMTSDLITAVTVPIDAVIYDLDGNLAGLMGSDGLPALPMVGDAASGYSIERLNLAGDWDIQSAPTAGYGPLMYEQVATVPIPSTLLLFVPGLMSLLGVQKFSRRQPS